MFYRSVLFSEQVRVVDDFTFHERIQLVGVVHRHQADLIFLVVDRVDNGLWLARVDPGLRVLVLNICLRFLNLEGAAGLRSFTSNGRYNGLLGLSMGHNVVITQILVHVKRPM